MYVDIPSAKVRYFSITEYHAKDFIVLHMEGILFEKINYLCGL